MKTRPLILLASLFFLSFALVGCDDDDDPMTGMDDDDMDMEEMQPASATFEVTIENVGVATPLLKSGVFNTPEGASSPGPATPGNSYQFSFTAGPNEVPGSGMQLSFATMFIQSNDLFYAPQPGGIALFDDDGTPIGANAPANVTDQVALWDAGTEGDQEPGTGADQAPRQSAPDTGPAGEGTLVEVTQNSSGTLEDDGFTYPAVSDVIEVTVESQPDDASGAIEFTVTISNVSDETGTQANGAPIPLSPGTYAAHFDQTPSGTDVQFVVPDAPAADSPSNPEGIAEDGDPSGSIESLSGLTGVTVPLSPGAFAVHSDDVQLFELGGQAGGGIEGIAEDGSPADLASALSGLEGVTSSGAFPAENPAPIAPTPPDADPSSFTFTVEAEEGELLSFATMYIQSNDLFYAFDPNGLALFEDGNPISGEQTVRLYDAGTEGDEEPGAGLNQAPRQSEADTGPDGEGSVAEVTDTDDDDFLDDDGFNYAVNADVIRVTVTPQ